jgi:ABC-2 type transport system ATP-binding protein
VILSSHLLHEVEQICNRVAIIDNGRLLLTTDRITEAFELLAKDARLAVTRNGDGSLYLQVADELVPDINALLVQNGFRVKEIASHRESLEEVFLRLTREARLPNQS